MNNITPQEASERLRANRDAVLIDVREASEFAAVHAEGARNVPLGDIPSRMKEFAEAPEIFFICQLGGRSARATAFAQSAGLHQAKNVSGGTTGWIRDGLPIIKMK